MSNEVNVVTWEYILKIVSTFQSNEVLLIYIMCFSLYANQSFSPPESQTSFCTIDLRNLHDINSMWQKLFVIKREDHLQETCHLETGKITPSNFICIMALSLLATFVTADFILNINRILFMLECATVGCRFYSEPSWLASVGSQLNDTLWASC